MSLKPILSTCIKSVSPLNSPIPGNILCSNYNKSIVITKVMFLVFVQLSLQWLQTSHSKNSFKPVIICNLVSVCRIVLKAYFANPVVVCKFALCNVTISISDTDSILFICNCCFVFIYKKQFCEKCSRIWFNFSQKTVSSLNNDFHDIVWVFLWIVAPFICFRA